MWREPRRNKGGIVSNSCLQQVKSAKAWIKDRYEHTDVLQSSLLGKVLIGTRKNTSEKEVIKLCVKDLQTSLANRVAENPAMEIEVMEHVCTQNHSYLVGLLDAVEDDTLFCTALEYIPNGDLCTYIQNHGAFALERARKYTRQLVEAVTFVHNSGYCHLDLSLENLLFDEKMDRIKLCDFGLCRKLISGQYPASYVRPGKKGYIAPEIYGYQPFNGETADVFAIGVIIFILLTGFPPFNRATNSDKCFRFLFNRDCATLLSKWKLLDVIPSSARDLLNRIFVPAHKRISLTELLRHPYLDVPLDSPRTSEVLDIQAMPELPELTPRHPDEEEEDTSTHKSEEEKKSQREPDVEGNQHSNSGSRSSIALQDSVTTLAEQTAKLALIDSKPPSPIVAVEEAPSTPPNAKLSSAAILQ